MKQNASHRITLLVFMAAFLLTGCEKPLKGDEAEITEEEVAVEPTGQIFAIDTAKAWVKFTGYGVGKNHPGMFKLTYGTVSVYNDTLSGGSFLIDIKSMKMEQQGKDIKTKLRPHLLSGDFFDADNFGTAKFEITNVVSYEPRKNEKSLVEGANFLVSGNLTLKGVTKNISFPARIDLDGNTLKAKANFDINRTEWQMNYGNDRTIGDKFISEKVNINLDVQAKKQENSV